MLRSKQTNKHQWKHNLHNNACIAYIITDGPRALMQRQLTRCRNRANWFQDSAAAPVKPKSSQYR